MANLKIKLVKSLNGRLDKHIATAYSLGLHKIGNETVQPDNPQNVVTATMKGLESLRDAAQVGAVRGKSAAEVLGRAEQ